MSKKVYTFGDGKAEGNAAMRNLLGGKGANLAEMNLLGMPVPPGFTITTEVCTEYTAIRWLLTSRMMSRLPLHTSKTSRATSLTIPATRCSSLSVPVLALPCPA